MNMLCHGIIHIAIWNILLLRTQTRGQVETRSSQVELVGPQSLVALGDDLKVQYRFMVSNGNGSEKHSEETTVSFASPCFIFQLTLMEDGREVSIAAERLKESVFGLWNQVRFGCGLVVKGGEYHVHLINNEMRNCSDAEDDSDSWNVNIIASVTVQVTYPAIDFEVPTRLETYSASVPISFGLTRTLCKPKVPLPSTELRLSVCQSPLEDCNRDFATVLEQPLVALQRDGRVTVTVGCELWARNLTYRLQIVEKFPRVLIARSQPIKVEWSSRFSLNVSRTSILPCRGSLRVTVSNPNCLMATRDKIRIQGYETSMVPTLINSGHPFYIGEQLIQPHLKFVNIKCNMFPQRFSRVCFQYINTAIDLSVAVVLEHCIHMYPIHTVSDGGWGPWSPWSSCSSTCGLKGKQYRFRFCDSPPPTTSSTFCKGNAIEEAPCNTVNNCSGGDGVWSSPADHTTNTESSLLHYEHEDDEGDMEVDLDHYDEYQHREDPERGSTEDLWSQGRNVNFSFQGAEDCECGCHLRNLTPGVNNNLTIYISLNESSCYNGTLWNGQESDHSERLQWILHAKDNERRLRVVFMDWSIQCSLLTVRDGETADSNLLKIISGDSSGRRSGIVVQSNGPSLTIVPAPVPSSLHAKCSSPFIFFVAYASDFLPASLEHDTGNPLAVNPNSKSFGGMGDLSVETLILLLLKLVLVVLSGALLCSAVGILATRGLRGGRKQFTPTKDRKKRDSSSEGVEPEDGEGLMPVEVSSRSTSVTLMSFDYALWKQCRLLKLKHFLLRPRRGALRTKSVPNTPMSSELQIALLEPKRSKLHKSPSYPENNLKARKSRPMKSLPLQDAPLKEKKEKKKVISQEGKNSSHRESSSGKKVCSSEHMKLQKENFNLKRKANERQKEIDERSTVSPPNEVADRKGGHKDMDSNRATDSKSQLSFTSSLTDFARSSSHLGGSASQSGLGESIQDFEMEMDYYDYDVANASTIPGSYLALEPTFVLWSSELEAEDSLSQIHVSPTIIDFDLAEKSLQSKSDTVASTSKD